MKWHTPLLFASLALALGMAPLQSNEVSETWEIESELETFNETMKQLRSSPVRGRFVKIRDLVDIAGEESIKMSGFGIVSGLHKSGDTSKAAKKMMIKVAKEQGIHLSEDDIGGQNMALVSISAEVNPHQRRFDLSVKSIGDAKSLQNGFLEPSTLSPVGSSEVFAIASGSIALGSRHFEAQGQDSLSSVTIGHPTMGFVLQGGELIQEIPSSRLFNNQVKLYLKHPNNRTATNIANSINTHLQSLSITAEPKNASTILVSLPSYFRKTQGRLTRILADLNDLPSTVSRKATITVDQGSGIIAMTNDVKMEPGSLTIGGLTVTVTTEKEPIVSQAEVNPAKTEKVDHAELSIEQEEGNIMLLPAGTDLRVIQQMFNAMKITPETMMSVFNAMHQSGMIHADIVVIPK